MNETARPRIFLFLLLLLGLGVGACSKPPAEPAPLAGARIGGPFTLTDQNGRKVSNSDFDGRYRLVYFGFSYCPDVCPVDLQTIGQGLAKFEKEEPALASKVQPIFITVDPERDRPEVLKPFVQAFHPRLIGLTGTPDEIASVAKAHGVYYARREGSSPKDYLMDHMRTAILFGPKGEPIAILPHDQGSDQVAAELGKWVS
jgi:protein SCO1/2